MQKIFKVLQQCTSFDCIMIETDKQTDHIFERKILMKRTISLLTALAVAGSMSVPALAAGSDTPMEISPNPAVTADATMQVIVNGQFVTEDTYQVGGGVMVPVRAVAEALGFKVTWNDDWTVNLNDGNMQCNLAIGDNFYVVYTANPELIGMSSPFELESAPELKNFTTYVPVSLFVPLLGNDPDTVTLENNRIIITSEADPNGSAQIPSPLTEHDTLAELEKAVGFQITQPAMPQGYTVTSILDIGGELAQIVYTNGTNDELVYRISRGNGDNSGDYTVYSNRTKLQAKGVSVHLRGDDAIHVADWSCDGFAYSISASEGLTQEQVMQIVESTLV